MKLRAIHVSNWACIESLKLNDLSDGIVVLHGPNGTGKSSLVQALRSTLFDHFHDSQESTLQAATPWRSKLTPSVMVEFEHAGQHYRITKTYARTQEGQSVLERHDGGAWTTLIRGKEASKRVREIVDAASSSAGVFQMLWLDQKSFHLPKPADLDATLQNSLRAILGALITAADIEFKDRLDRENERWFTVKKMTDKRDSPVTRLAADLEQAQQHAAEIERQWDDAASALARYEEAQTRLPDLQRDFAEAQADLHRLQAECQSVRERQARYDSAAQIVEQCKTLEAKAARRLADFDETARRLGESETALAQTREQLRDAEVQRDHAATTHAEARAQWAAMERALESHQQDRPLLTDRQRLLTLHQESQAIQQLIERVVELDRTRQDLEQKLVGPAPLNEKQISELRRNREQAAQKRAKLEADEIHVVVTLKQPLDLRVATDGQPVDTVASVEVHRWLVRQRAELQIGDSAVVHIRRGEEDRDLEALARAVEDLDRVYRDAVVGAGLDTADPGALDQLTARRVQHERLALDLESARADLAKAAPTGIPALRTHLQQKENERQLILARRPNLGAWVPTQLEVDRLSAEFDQREESLKDNARKAKQAHDLTQSTMDASADRVQKLREASATQEANVKSLRDALAQADRATLVYDLETAQKQRTEAEQNVAASTLTDSEKAIEGQLRSAQADHAQRSQRLRDNEDLRLRLQTQLAGTEGLYQKRIQAKQAVEELGSALLREQHYAGAHKHLKELFDEVRHELTCKTFGPINDRVMQWSRQLGLTDYTRLEFGELLPEGLISAHGVDAHDLHCESHGTVEQLSLLIRLAIGGLLARKEPTVAILDDPLAHSDPGKHRKMLDILTRAVAGDSTGPHPTGSLQLIILTCHADRFDHLDGAHRIDLTQHLRRGG